MEKDWTWRDDPSHFPLWSHGSHGRGTKFKASDSFFHLWSKPRAGVGSLESPSL